MRSKPHTAAARKHGGECCTQGETHQGCHGKGGAELLQSMEKEGAQLGQSLPMLAPRTGGSSICAAAGKGRHGGKEELLRRTESRGKWGVGQRRVLVMGVSWPRAEKSRGAPWPWRNGTAALEGERRRAPWWPSSSPQLSSLHGAGSSSPGRAPFQQGRPGPDGPCAAPPRGQPVGSPHLPSLRISSVKRRCPAAPASSLLSLRACQVLGIM